MKTILLISVLFFSFVPSQRCTLLKKINNKKVSLFINHIYDDAVRVQKLTNAPLAIIISQSCLETGYGKSNLCANECNFFGVKRNHAFCKYESMEASFDDYAKVLNQSCYLKHKPKTIAQWCKVLKLCGYNKKDKYYKDLNWIIKHFGLDKLK